MENITLYQFIVFIIGTGGISALSQLPKLRDISNKDKFNQYKEIYDERSQYGPQTLKSKTKLIGSQLFSLQVFMYFILEGLLIWWILDLNIYGNKNFIFTFLFEKPENIVVTKVFLVFTIVLGFINVCAFTFQTILPWVRLLKLYTKVKYEILTRKI